MLFAAMGFAQQLETYGAFKVGLSIVGSLVFGLVCALVYYNEKNNEHRYADPKVDIETQAHYEDTKK